MMGVNPETTVVTRALLVHPSSEAATRLATALADAAPTVSVAVATTPDDAAELLRDSRVDCIVNGFDPAEQAGVDLIQTLGNIGPDVPQVLAPVADAADAERIAERMAAAVPGPVTDHLDAVPGVGCLVTPDGDIVRANDRAAEVLGGDTRNVSGHDLTDLVPADERDRLFRALAEAVENGDATAQVPVAAPDERPPHEWTLTRLDGLVDVVGIDVSTRMDFAAELRDTEASLAALYDTLSNRDLSFEARLQRILELGCDRLDVEYGFLTRINGDTQRIVESHGSHPLLQPGEQCPLSEAYCRKAIRGEALLGVHDAIAQGWESDPAFDAFGLGCYLGGKVVAEQKLYGTLCFADAEPRGTTFSDAERTFVELLTRWVSYELEERIAREKLERQNDRLSEFASIVSHDIRNPLNVAKGQLQLARETDDPEHFDEAEDALDRMEQLVTGLLDLAKQGSVIESVADVTLSEVTDDAWANVATEDATLVVDQDGVVEADRDRLLQLLENLLRNSVEHGSTENRPEADDSVEPSSTNTDALTIHVGVLTDGFYVSDSGPGIAPDERDTVFERGHTTGGGSGLGLTIVKAIADAHGWEIEVTDGADGGARFEFTGVDRPVVAG